METTTTKYQVTRISTSLTTYKETRTYKQFDSLEEAIDWAKRHSTKDNITCKVFALACEWDEDDEVYVWPCTARDAEYSYDPVYEKRGNYMEVFTEEPKAEVEPEPEPPAAPEHPEPVRYYAVLLIAENRKKTKFHYKRKMFWDDQQAIDFARSRLRGGCRAAWVYMYDPVVTNVPPELFESDNPKRDTDNIGKFLGRLEIFSIDRTSERDMRAEVRKRLTA